MNPERAHAYRRVIDTLAELGPAKLQADEAGAHPLHGRQPHPLRATCSTTTLPGTRSRTPSCSARCWSRAGAGSASTADRLIEDLRALRPRAAG